MSQRTDRVADSLRKELSVLLMREVRDPRVALATISRVQVARDLGHARIWISVLGDEETRQQTMAGIEHAKGFLRSQIGRRLKLRVTPELAFELDRGAEYLQDMTELLDKLHKEPSDT
ncbi:MAG: 30S ribosome-binding factor RbfA [Thermoanaerobaculia bacterium]|jgi:ribosome-binding factor A|nr:30S ribosome-binding factor RbfA [Thermoanaerobaculia bacterium]MBP9823273.1 30S ribosome-binding factor RbfA [Thermoanaerobaculia bacterium]